ncbi:hypothetical protein DXG01_006170, partial [Tephrocybe rancida]
MPLAWDGEINGEINDGGGGLVASVPTSERKQINSNTLHSSSVLLNTDHNRRITSPQASHSFSTKRSRLPMSFNIQLPISLVPSAVTELMAAIEAAPAAAPGLSGLLSAIVTTLEALTPPTPSTGSPSSFSPSSSLSTMPQHPMNVSDIPLVSSMSVSSPPVDLAPSMPTTSLIGPSLSSMAVSPMPVVSPSAAYAAPISLVHTPSLSMPMPTTPISVVSVPAPLTPVPSSSTTLSLMSLTLLLPCASSSPEQCLTPFTVRELSPGLDTPTSPLSSPTLIGSSPSQDIIMALLDSPCQDVSSSSLDPSQLDSSLDNTALHKRGLDTSGGGGGAGGGGAGPGNPINWNWGPECVRNGKRDRLLQKDGMNIQTIAATALHQALHQIDDHFSDEEGGYQEGPVININEDEDSGNMQDLDVGGGNHDNDDYLPETSKPHAQPKSTGKGKGRGKGNSKSSTESQKRKRERAKQTAKEKVLYRDWCTDGTPPPLTPRATICLATMASSLSDTNVTKLTELLLTLNGQTLVPSSFVLEPSDTSSFGNHASSLEVLTRLIQQCEYWEKSAMCDEYRLMVSYVQLFYAVDAIQKSSPGRLLLKAIARDLGLKHYENFWEKVHQGTFLAYIAGAEAKCRLKIYQALGLPSVNPQ